MSKVIFDGQGEMPELNRITAKKNYASSSQSHKMGATAMFNDILHYLAKEKYPALLNEVGGLVAVRQHPVYAFQKIKKEGTDEYIRRFIGLFTVGADKGDKNYFGFTEDRVKDKAIRLEGTDHIKGVGFNYPYRVNGVDKIRYNHAEESLCIVTGGDKTKWTKIWEQSYCANKKTESEIESYLKEKYMPAYEIAYNNNPLIVGVDMTIDAINADIDAFGKLRRTKDDRQYSYCEFWIDGEYDIYYLDAETNKYEKNGINLLTDLGIAESELSGMTVDEKNELFINKRVERFKAEWENYFCKEDAIYQLAFLFIICASDNFEKNMYPYLMDLLWRFFQDDLDSIFSTDNQGQDTKSYSAELHDFTDDSKSAYVFKGEDSAFWQLVELACTSEFKQMGHDILQAMYDLAPSGTTTTEKLMSFFDEYFFSKAQNYFPCSAYNNDTEYSYEEAWNNKEYVASVDIHPLAQALGSHESTERAWLEKRIIYLMSKFGFGGFSSYNDTALGVISVRTQDAQSFTLTPAIDMYPAVLGGQAQIASADHRIKAGEAVTLPAVGGGNTNVYIVGADWLSDIGDLKDLKIDPSSVVTLSIASKRLRRLKVGDENAEEVASYLASLAIQRCDSMESVDARNLQTLIGTVDLSQCPRLIEALFGGTNTTAIIIAAGSKIERLELPDSITTIDLRDTKFLEDLNIGTLANVRFLRLESVPTINAFGVLKEAYNTEGQQLKDIRLVGFTYDGDATDLDMIANLATDKDKDGNEHYYNGIDSNGVPDANSHPVLEGNLNIDGYVYEETADIVRQYYPTIEFTPKGYYVRFADPEVLRVLLANGVGDGVGITTEQAEAVTDISSWFVGNTVIETFDEFEKFINITSLGGYAFTRCVALMSIKLPPSITSISSASSYLDGTFNGCTSLVRVGSIKNIESIGNYSFSGCNSLSEFSFEDNQLKSIGTQAFYNCTSLEIEDLSLPNLTTLGQNAFYGVKIKKMLLGKEGVTLTLHTADTSTQNFGDKSVLEEVELHGVTIIPNYCFYGYTCLVLVDFAKVTSVGTAAFYKANFEDKEINLQSAQTLGGAAFAYSNITKVVSLGEVTEISAQAQTGDWLTGQPGVFAGCSSLTSVILPSMLKKIGVNAFANCSSLADMILPGGLEVLNSYALKGCPQLRVDYLPESITTIGMDVFYENANMLDDVVLPNLTGSLGGGAFAKTNIKRVLDLGNITATGVSSVYWPTNNGAGPFAGCVELELLVLPPSLTSIQHGLAAGCTALKAVVVKATTPPTLGNNCFLNTNNCPIYVPDASVEAYKTATNWSNYADRIKPLSDYYMAEFPNHISDIRTSLVCWYNTKVEGATNASLQAGGLKDLSGNGYNLSMSGFEYTEESGLAADGGIVFSGAQSMGASGLPILTDFTVVAKRKWVAGSGAFATKGRTENSMFRGAFAIERNASGSRQESFGQLNTITRYPDDIIWMTPASYCGTAMQRGTMADGSILQVGTTYDYGSSYWSGSLYSFALFNRTLTDDEIEWVKNNMM